MRRTVRQEAVYGFRSDLFNLANNTGVVHSFNVHGDLLESSVSPFGGTPGVIEIQQDEEIDIELLAVQLTFTAPAAGLIVYDANFEIDLRDSSATTQQVIQRRARTTEQMFFAGGDPTGHANAHRSIALELPSSLIRARDLQFSTGGLRFITVFLDLGTLAGAAGATTFSVASAIRIRRYTLGDIRQ